jgi:CAI-1 autoinducer synthase
LLDALSVQLVFFPYVKIKWLEVLAWASRHGLAKSAFTVFILRIKQMSIMVKNRWTSDRNLPLYEQREDEYYDNRVKRDWSGGHIMRGRIPDADALMLVSNDYLAIAKHPEILQAQSEALLRMGNGLLMSGIFLHGDNPQARLESRLAAFLKAEDVVLCQSGWCANVGLLQTIANEDTPVYLDMLAHMSLWEGVKSAGAKAHYFQHNDMAHLERQIRRHGPGIVVVDALYSTNGSICPLRDLVAVGRRYGCVLVVDESHSLGTHGPGGEGLVVSLGLAEQVHFRTASLAKAFAGRAGLITCSSRFSDYFNFTSLPAIFSSTLLVHEIAALQKTLDIIIAADERRKRLEKNAARLREGLIALGYDVSVSQSQIIPLEAGPEWRTIILRDALEARKVFGSVFCAPATAKNRSMIRLSVHADLTETQLQYLLSVCAEIRDEVRPQSWPINRKRGLRRA